uniref:Uncharacterized protein n=1 Tax=Thermogemmatispora argillosa TaxID=2045280 RepID=A0A455SYY1_9CHLR|nr:hypothetical protein KTA_10990 [Thermogemmatispora argillosa]
MSSLTLPLSAWEERLAPRPARVAWSPSQPNPARGIPRASQAIRQRAGRRSAWLGLYAHYRHVSKMIKNLTNHDICSMLVLQIGQSACISGGEEAKNATVASGSRLGYTALAVGCILRAS